MKLPPALLENWMRDYYFDTDLDLGSSGVDDFTMVDLRRLLGLTEADFDRVVFADSMSLGGEGLRRALADRWLGGDTSRVMATHGSSEANFLLDHALLRPGDEVVVLDPCYPQLFAIAEALGCTLKQWPLRWENGFVPDVEEAKRLIGPRTRMVVVNFPHNPTGATLAPEQQDELIAACERVGAYLLCDNAFQELVHDGPPLPEPVLRYERAISTGTFSKAYGLPGLRVGWCFAAPEVLEQMVRVRDYVTLHLSPLVEMIAERAIDGADRLLAERLGLARMNREVVAEWVEDHADFVEWVPPRGGVAAFPRLHAVPDVEAFCHRLAQEQRVLLVPGSCFGHPQHVRLGFGRSTRVLEEGLARLSHLLQGTAAPALV
ncbi:MAG TPA: capreomycidine synthase [Longimicrobiaceae bacterium]|nr:capreomycidine synthase [Longimicrobiaceae bacterium]